MIGNKQVIREVRKVGILRPAHQHTLARLCLSDSAAALAVVLGTPCMQPSISEVGSADIESPTVPRCTGSDAFAAATSLSARLIALATRFESESPLSSTPSLMANGVGVKLAHAAAAAGEARKRREAERRTRQAAIPARAVARRGELARLGGAIRKRWSVVYRAEARCTDRARLAVGLLFCLRHRKRLPWKPSSRSRPRPPTPFRGN